LVDTFRKVDAMSRMAKDALGRRARRQFSEEFKDGAVRLVLDEGRPGV
jgi:transposase-like protein